MEQSSEQAGAGDSKNPQIESYTDKRERYVEAAYAQLWALIALMLYVVTATIVPIMTLVFIAVANLLFSPIPVVTINPLGVALSGTGIPVTHVITATALIKLAQRLYNLNTAGYPEIRQEPTETSEDD